MGANEPEPSPVRPFWVPMQVEGRGDREISRIAAGQRGLITREQLLVAGLGRGAIAHRLRHGRLHRVHRGVYLVGHPSRGPLVAEMAAVLYVRGHAILSHWSAAAMWGLLDCRPAEVNLTIVGRDHGPDVACGSFG